MNLVLCNPRPSPQAMAPGLDQDQSARALGTGSSRWCPPGPPWWIGGCCGTGLDVDWGVVEPGSMWIGVLWNRARVSPRSVQVAASLAPPSPPKTPKLPTPTPPPPLPRASRHPYSHPPYPSQPPQPGHSPPPTHLTPISRHVGAPRLHVDANARRVRRRRCADRRCVRLPAA